MPEVSILMAHSGRPDFLRPACQSIQTQEYRDFELIVVDDGAGVDWNVELRALRCPWRVLRNSERRGLARCMNQAARAASGELLARMDSDDVSAPARLKRQVAHLKDRPQLAVLGSAVRWLDSTNMVLGRNYPLTDSEDLALGLSIYNQMSHGSVVMRRSAFEDLGGYDESMLVAQDYDLWLRAVHAGYSAENLPEPLYGQRLHESSVSSRAAATQGAAAAAIGACESMATRSARVAGWFASGRHGRLGRPYEGLQLGRLALLLLAAVASRRIGPSQRGTALRFAARHAGSSLELLAREAGWRHNTASKLASLLQCSAGRSCARSPTA